MTNKVDEWAVPAQGTVYAIFVKPRFLPVAGAVIGVPAGAWIIDIAKVVRNWLHTETLIRGARDPRLMRGELRIYRNREGYFERMETNLPGVVLGSAKFADFNRDGRADIVVTGSPDALSTPLFEAYVHLSGGDFRNIASPFGLTAADLTVGDFNYDGDIDIAGIGRAEDGQLHTLFYHNLMVLERTADYFERNPDNLRNIQIIPDRFGNWSGCYQNYTDW